VSKKLTPTILYNRSRDICLKLKQFREMLRNNFAGADIEVISLYSDDSISISLNRFIKDSTRFTVELVVDKDSVSLNDPELSTPIILDLDDRDRFIKQMLDIMNVPVFIAECVNRMYLEETKWEKV